MSDLSNLPAIPAAPEHSRPGPAPLLDPARQARFCEILADHGNVRLAARALGVCPQTAYRARRASPAFAACWDGALLIARRHAEMVLAERALEGVEESVFYHGEEVATRRRFDSRLLLAHLARLDRLAEQVAARAEAGEAGCVGEHAFDEALEALGRGEAWRPAVPEPEHAPAAGPLAVPSTGGPKPELLDVAEEEPLCPELDEYCRVCDSPAGDTCRAWTFTREDLLDRADPAHWVDGEYRDPFERELRALAAESGLDSVPGVTGCGGGEGVAHPRPLPQAGGGKVVL